MKIRLIVPNCNRNTSPIVAYGMAIADIAGGFTASQATGGWIDGKGKLIVEPVTVFDCFVVPDGVVCGKFYDLAKRIATELHQDCVYLEIDGMAQFVKK
jgi:hypothetical protein